MENPAVHRVLDQAPNQDAAGNQPRHDAERQSALHHREVEHVTHQRQIDDERSRRMHMGKNSMKSLSNMRTDSFRLET